MALTPIGLIRKIGKLARGGVTPSQVFLGCLLGVMLGMVPRETRLRQMLLDCPPGRPIIGYR